MFRSRKIDSSNFANGQRSSKRRAVSVKDEPKRMRCGLSDLSNVMSSSLCIDSARKCSGNLASSKIAQKQPDPGFSSAVYNKVKSIKEKLTSRSGLGDSTLPTGPSAVLKKTAHDEDDAMNVCEEAQNSKDNDICREPRPDPEDDFDIEHLDDPFMVSEYAWDIFKYYKHREKGFCIGDYASRRLLFTKDMRAVVVDWIVEIQQDIGLYHESVYLAVKIMDHFLDKSRARVEGKYAQLLGATSLFIACKVEETFPPFLEDFVCVSGNSLTHSSIIKMERHILKAIGFDLGFPLAYHFLRRYSNVLGLDMTTLTLARYYLETCTLFYEFVGVRDSLMAAACLMLALHAEAVYDWAPRIVVYSGYRMEEVGPLMWSLNHAMWMRRRTYPSLRSSFFKYNSPVFFEVARIPLLDDRYAEGSPVGPPVELSLTKNKI